MLLAGTTLLGEELPDTVVATTKARANRCTGAAFLTLGTVTGGRTALATATNSLGLRTDGLGF